MSEGKAHIVGIGNALVDVVAAVGEGIVQRHGLTAGGMHLVDAEAAHALFEEVGPGVRQSGGSVANSIAHLADIGIQGSYLGKVTDDELGRTFVEEMSGLGIKAPVVAGDAAAGVGSGRCVILVTPDGERTMSTYLGAAVTLAPEDIETAMPATFDVLFIEGYLWDAPRGPDVIAAAAARAKAAGASVALTPSDAGCVERNREAMLAFIHESVDILVGNHLEVGALAGNDDTDAAVDWALTQVAIAAVTEHDKGSIVASASERHRIEAAPVARVVDTTGAGDAYASGFLGGLVQGKSLAESGEQGARLAAQVLAHFGARDGAAARAIELPAA